MKKGKSIVKLLPLVLSLCFLCLNALPVAAEVSQTAPLSPALQVLADTTDLSLWHLTGEEQAFSEDSFLRGLNLSRLSTVRLCELPNPAQGVLRLDKRALAVGDTLSGEELSRMSFEAASKSVKKTSFRFEINGCGVAYCCNLYALDAPNASPAVDAIPTLFQKVKTHKNLPLSGRFAAKDPEGDAMTYEIAVPPQYGSITVEGDCYTYLPFSDYVGEDAFSYVARDLYGNYSSAVKVSLSVNAVATDLVFADLDDPATCNAVLTLASAGILGGTKVGNKSYFYPERAMTRVEFLVLAMSATGITDLPACKDTGFADDDEIPAAMKPYVATAYRLGYIEGQIKDGKVCFLPACEMTVGEGARLVDRLLLLDAGKSVAAGAWQTKDDPSRSVVALAEVGLISSESAFVRADEILSRGDAAKLLAGVFLLCN